MEHLEFKSVIKEIDSRFDSVEEKDTRLLSGFVLDLIPVNIFMALSEGKTLKIIFFSIVFGIMLKFISQKSSDILIKSFDGIFEAFQMLIKCAMYFLPFGFCALLADQFSKVGFSVLASLITLVSTYPNYAVTAIIAGAEDSAAANSDMA